MTEKELREVGLKTTFEDILSKLQLTDRQADIFKLRYGRGMCIVDIAAEIGLSTKTVCTELSVIRKKMAQLKL